MHTTLLLGHEAPNRPHARIDEFDNATPLFDTMMDSWEMSLAEITIDVSGRNDMSLTPVSGP